VRYSSATQRLQHVRSQDTCRTSASHELPAATATLNTRKTPLPHCNAVVAHTCTQHSETQKHEQSTTNTIPRSAAPSHSSHNETRCSDAHATTQSRNRNTVAQHPTHCARDSAGKARPRRESYIARMTQPRCFTFRRRNAHPTHMPTSATLPATITPPTCAHRHTRCDKPHPAQHHVSVMAEYRHTSPTPPHDVPHSTNHCALHKHHRMHTAARTPHTRHTQLGTQLRPPHTPRTANHTQSRTLPPRHTHVRVVRLPTVDGMLPESWLLCKSRFLQDTRAAITSYHSNQRRRRPQRPVARNATHRSADVE
jgi:hypothetical protein